MSPFADRLARAIAVAPRRRILLADLWQAAHEADVSLAGAPDARARLLAGLVEVERAGLVRLPAPRGAGWEADFRPALPRWVMRQAEAGPERTPPPPVVWHAPSTRAASGIANPQPRFID